MEVYAKTVDGYPILRRPVQTIAIRGYEIHDRGEGHISDQIPIGGSRGLITIPTYPGEERAFPTQTNNMSKWFRLAVGRLSLRFPTATRQVLDQCKGQVGEYKTREQVKTDDGTWTHPMFEYHLYNNSEEQVGLITVEFILR